jgi:hypothetical protein
LRIERIEQGQLRLRGRRLAGSQHQHIDIAIDAGGGHGHLVVLIEGLGELQHPAGGALLVVELNAIVLDNHTPSSAGVDDRPETEGSLAGGGRTGA